MRGHQRLVGGDDVLLVGERRPDHRGRHALGAPDQLDDNIDLRVGGHRHRVLVPAHRRQIDATVAAAVASRYRRDDQPPAGARRQQFGLAIEQLDHAGADRAEAGDRDLQCRFHRLAPA